MPDTQYQVLAVRHARQKDELIGVEIAILARGREDLLGPRATLGGLHLLERQLIGLDEVIRAQKPILC